MGWLFTTMSRKQTIADLTHDWEREEKDESIVSKCLAHCYRGGSFSGVLWTVWEQTTTNRKDGAQSKRRFIGCDLLQCRSKEWGYKNMSESVHPYYYSCPMGYLKLVPIETYGGCAEWRAKVQLRHLESLDRRREKRAHKQFTGHIGTEGYTH